MIAENSDKLILLVEDNPDDEALTLRALRKNNVPGEIIVVHNGVEALEFFFDTDDDDFKHALPHLVLLDLKLPKIDGLEVLRRIRASERTRLVPVVVLTSSREERDLVESYRLGANSYIRKPVDFVHFMGAVRSLGQYWLSINENAPSSNGRI